MGWTYTHRAKGISTLDWYRSEWGDGVIDAAPVGWSEAYIAFKTREGKVLGVACLTRWASKSWYNYGRKEMQEGMGPYIYRCPERILDQLSPVDELYEPGSDSHRWASDWRKRCREYHQKRRKDS